ncbi:MAG TPA: hypothetical protein VGI19_18390 [Candidatus Cybelea sp.]|jgi:plastocyanin
MVRVLAAMIAISLMVACGGSHGTTGPMQAIQPIPLGDNLAITEVVPPKTIGVGYPPQIGQVFSKVWKANVAGYTQTHYSQTLGFEPGTKITITNISKGIDHTLNVIAKRSGPPANFPKSPTLLTSRSGGSTIKVGWRSGILTPGKKVSLTLVKGEYLIGCAFHYQSNGMRDVLVVESGAKPGPHATPPAQR